MNKIAKNLLYPETISPLRMLVVLLSVVFIAELSIMFALGMFAPIPEWVANLLDAFVLTALLFPALYFWIFRPMTLLIVKHEQAEAELLEIRDLLEHITETREHELQAAKSAADSMSAEIERLRSAHAG